MYERKNQSDAYECEWFDSYEDKNWPDSYACEWFDSYKEGVLIDAEWSVDDWSYADSFELIAVIKLKSEMIIAETRLLAKNITIEMIVADATSFVVQLNSKMIFAETKSFVESITDKIIAVDAASFAMKLASKMIFAETKSFNQVNLGPFLFWYEVWTGASEADAAEATEATKVDVEADDSVGWFCCTKITEATGASEAFHASDATSWIDL